MFSLLLLTAMKQFAASKQEGSSSGGNAQGVGFARSELVVRVASESVCETCGRRSGAVRLPFETAGTTNGREQFSCSLKRQPRPRLVWPSDEVLWCFGALIGYTEAFSIA
jgi:hypothetical protein